jgi:hypothetical protein
MPAKLTLHPPKGAAMIAVIRDGESLEIGRDLSCDLVLEDSSVSRRHARVGWNGGGWMLVDVSSRNGTTVNGEPLGTELRDGDSIGLGRLRGRFERLSAAQAATLDSERLARIQSSAQMRRRLSRDLGPADLLVRLLESAMELTLTERGFGLVVGPDGKLRVKVAFGFSPAALHEDRFHGSVGAARQVLETGAPVVLADVRADPRLGKRPSVAALGIASLACVPLRQEGKIVGLIYVDSRNLGPSFTQLELEILEALADHAATILAEMPFDHKARAFPGDGVVVAELQQRIDKLLPAV